MNASALFLTHLVVHLVLKMYLTQHRKTHRQNLFLWSLVYCAANKSQSDTVCEESSTMIEFTPQEVWKRYAVQLGIGTGSSNTNISERLGFDLKIYSSSYWWKPNIQSTSWCMGWPLVMVMIGFHSSFYMASGSTRLPTSSILSLCWRGSRGSLLYVT